jgi:hypothetical protein
MEFSVVAPLQKLVLSDLPIQGDVQETGLMSRPRSLTTSTNDSYEEDRAALASKAVPVTPGVHTAGHSAYFEAKRESGEADQPHIQHDNVSPGPNWNANTYRAPKKENESGTAPSVAATDAKSAEEVLRQLKKAANGESTKKEMADVDPRAAHPRLGLSGHIISATFVVPYSIDFAPDKEWARVFFQPFQHTTNTFSRSSTLDVALLRSSNPFPTSHPLIHHGITLFSDGLERSRKILPLFPQILHWQLWKISILRRKPLYLWKAR